MAYDITLEGNYIYIDHNGIDLLDHPSGDVIFEKKLLNGEEFCVYKRGYPETGYQGVRWDDFTLDGVPFASLVAFETWKNENTGIASQGQTTGGVTPTPPTPAQGVVTSDFVQLDGNIIAGAKVVSFVFRGNDGTLNGSIRPNGYAKEFYYPNGEDLPQIDYTVPTSGGGGAATRGIYIDVSL